MERKKILVYLANQNNPYAQTKKIFRCLLELKNKHRQAAVDVSPVCEVGVRGVGGATSCVPLGLHELEGIMPRAAGFRPCRNLSSRSLRSLSGSSAALFAP